MQTGADSSTTRSACAKIILCGEHAVVYGRPAIALPLPALRTRASIARRHDHFEIRATDINHIVVMPRIPPPQLRKPHPLALIAWHTFQYLRVRPPHAVLTISSDIPVGSNLGSGAAVSIALARALGAFFHHELTPAEVSALAYEVEKQHHGTPSGIDNTVIAYEQPVWFVRGAAAHAGDRRLRAIHPDARAGGRGARAARGAAGRGGGRAGRDRDAGY